MAVKRTSNYGKVAKGIAGLNGARVLVGWDETSHYPDGTPVAYVAAIQEFGSPKNNIPQRSFMRTSMEEKRAEWIDLLQRGANRVMSGQFGADQMLGGFGMKAAGDVREKIASIESPPLKDATVKRKGNAKPLVDTGLMLATLTSKVEKR